ncbi:MULTISPECIES: ArsR family transcriptional regulator [Halorussus]|uniref:DUF7344 domain-containing protein n=1 Tax=Halorussus TaxID=1070314 RepID=UPI0013B46577|nr:MULTISPECIES: ArsR family transcriptional regulator [Halorussus]NHN58326.1 ArsR family transcriptional regulator [Halorussus sp. JP-T4]
MFDTLSDVQRRRILVAISDHNPRTEDEFVPDNIAPAEADDADRDRLKAELQHVHLPKLAEQGFIKWDAEARTIRRGPKFDEIAPLLRLMDDHRDDSSEGEL